MFSHIYNALIAEPIKKLYFNGPSVGMLGFWGGKHKSEICHLLTSVDSIFWDQNTESCERLLNDRFQAFQTTVEVVIYFGMMWQLFKFLPPLI